jgi:hypothetical protein
MDHQKRRGSTRPGSILTENGWASGMLALCKNV